MRLKLTVSETPKHTSIVAAVGWRKIGKQYELISCGDDQAVWKWQVEGSPIAKMCDLDNYCTAMACMPNNKGTDNCLALGCADGTLRLVSESGREEKKVEAHRGAVIAVKWTFDGTALATAGEDGSVKVWSRSGMLRSTLTQMPHAIYSIVWSPDCEHLLFACGRKIHLKSTQAGVKTVEWKAHDGVVMQLDWSSVSNTILSGGEDCRYKIWDSYGRLLFCSAPLDHVVTSVAWSPSGKFFAVGSYNVLKLCDRTGWSYCRDTPDSGSIFAISWCNDGTQLACGGGNGAVVFASLVDRTFSWHNVDVTLDERNVITVHDILQETKEELDFRDRVTDMSLAHGSLIVTTNNQCFVYNQGNWNTPHIEDLKDPPTLICQCAHHFALVDANGINIYSYEGRQLSTIKFQGLRPDFLNHQTLSICRDSLVMVDPSNCKQVRVFDILTGRAIGNPIQFKLDVVRVALNQHGSGADRTIAFLDKNKDLYLTKAMQSDKSGTEKLGSMVETFMWNDSTDMLIALTDDKLVTYIYPSVVFVDKDLLPKTQQIKTVTDAGKYAQIVAFYGANCIIRKADGADLAVVTTPYPQLLYTHFEKSQWEQAVRLCRYVKSPELWASLAAMATHSRMLDTVEIALAAIEEVDKVQFVAHIKKHNADEALRSAEMALFCKRPEEGLAILLQHKRIYRAIKMNIRLHRWGDALDLAMKHQTHVDTVLAYRQRHLQQMRHEETNEQFKQCAQSIEVDWDTVKKKIAMEKEAEARNASAASPPP
jgi:intraflagellar transport protein 80